MRWLLTLLIFLLISTTVCSQKIETKTNGLITKDWSIELPIWIPGFRGDFSYGDVSLEGEDGGNIQPPTPEHPIEPGEGLDGNIFSRFFNKESFLKFFYMTKISYKPKRFLFQIDGFGGAAGSSIKFNYNNKEIVSASYNFFIGNLYLGYSVFQDIDLEKEKKINLFAYTGLRYIHTNIQAALERGNKNFNISPGKWEVLLGINAEYFFEKWKFNFKTDFGGFISNSRIFSVKIQILAYYKIGQNTALRFGWTDFNFKHDDIFQEEHLVVNFHLSGPNTGVVFYF